jgi:hypothetical protein
MQPPGRAANIGRIAIHRRRCKRLRAQESRTKPPSVNGVPSPAPRTRPVGSIASGPIEGQRKPRGVP